MYRRRLPRVLLGAVAETDAVRKTLEEVREALDFRVEAVVRYLAEATQEHKRATDVLRRITRCDDLKVARREANEYLDSIR